MSQGLASYLEASISARNTSSVASANTPGTSLATTSSGLRRSTVGIISALHISTSKIIYEVLESPNCKESFAALIDSTALLLRLSGYLLSKSFIANKR